MYVVSYILIALFLSKDLIKFPQITVDFSRRIQILGRDLNPGSGSGFRIWVPDTGSGSGSYGCWVLILVRIRIGSMRIRGSGGMVLDGFQFLRG